MAQQVQSGTCEPPKGTIKPKCPFNPEEDSRKLREAMKGLGMSLLFSQVSLELVWQLILFLSQSWFLM